MQPEPWTYKSLHDYLDNLFKDKNPNVEEIVQAKDIYWRSYNKRLKQIQRQKSKEVTLSLDKKMLELIRLKLTANQSISDYFKEIINENLQIKVTNYSYKKEALLKIEQQLFTIIDYLESLLYQRRLIDKSQITILEKHLEQLQKLLEERL